MGKEEIMALFHIKDECVHKKRVSVSPKRFESLSFPKLLDIGAEVT